MKSQEIKTILDTTEKTERRFDQDLVDLVRANVFKKRLEACHWSGDEGWRPGYVWFPEPHINRRKWQYGTEPDDRGRPEHLRGIKLWVDPRKIINRLTTAGYDWQKLQNLSPQDAYAAIKRAMN